ncbi:cell wall-binding repeat-containing protein [Clostridium sp. CF012]|uniref:cell wall-binding repeat-containing protein n=1 Tax=Clostridium sp. CF012 TaxID=2843319 RepID=UPI001C0CB8DC|nr:cell wall-binding repeat-containing protein [Clostridium sp. CF012]MBU3143444.1 cell wall-binding repeat-containing protein [Clostridium sp. CF012]
MLKNKRLFLGALMGLLLCGVLNITPVFAQDTNLEASRLSGTNRYTTSVAISKSGWTESTTVIIATGLDYADALAASSLAKSKDAPILLTEKNAMNQNILTEIKRLKATEAILIGGAGVIGPGVESQLKGLEITITRVGGTDRYDTSKKIAETVGVTNGIIMATGFDFPDALSIAPISGIKSMPILLSPKNSMNSNIEEFVKGKNIPVSYIVGGTGVIGESVASSAPNRKRLGGANRYATNLIINENFQEDLNFDTIYLATGNNFPDALAGSVLAAKKNAPIFLTAKGSISFKILNIIRNKDVKHVVILGGTGVVSKDVENVITKPSRLLQQERISKGGVIGTGGKGVVALRFDDYQDIFGKKIYPLLLSRGLPSSMALISRFKASHYWGSGTTWDQVRNWNRNGVEIWSHGTDHNDYSPKGYAGLYSQIVTSKAEIEAQNIKVAGWALPGVTPKTKNLPYDGLIKPSDYNGIVGNLLMQTYAITEAYAYPYDSVRTLPTKIYHGLNHYTVSDDSGTLRKSKEAIDVAIKNKTGIEFMCHAGNLDKPRTMSLSDFTALLDYIKTKWDDGSIEVLTPSGLFFADPNSSSRLQLTTSHSFEGLTVNNPGAWSGTSQWTGKTIEKSGGKTGANFLRINSSITNSAVTQKITSLDKLKVSGEQFVLEGWFRANGDGNTTGMVQIDDPNKPNALKIMNKVVSNGSTWTKVRFVFSIPPNTKTITISLSRLAGVGIDWDDIIIKKI